MSDQCCSCPSLPNRCLTDECPCYTNRQPCRTDCETQKLSANCLNRPITRCSCGAPRRMPSPLRKSPAHHAMEGSPSLVAKACFCNSDQCECYRLREPCTNQCGCKKDGCSHTRNAELLYDKPKETRGTKSCRCSGGKKACFKSSKCRCRQTLGHCVPLACKCQQDCSNAPNMTLSKTARQAFLYPEQETTALGLIHVLRHYYGVEADCEPRCEVLQYCTAQKACARLLAVCYAQTQRHMKTCDLRMTLKFLCPYVKRGDLYTQQGILHMMESGISVEPLVQQEWTSLLGHDTTGSTSTPTASPLLLWGEHHMDDYVRQSQHYINVCRRTLGIIQILRHQLGLKGL